MSDIRESFPILEDANSVGAPITQAVPGTTAASAIASTLAAPVFQNSAGILVYPQLTPAGAIAVDTDAQLGTKNYASASAAGSLTEVLVTTVTLTASKKIEDIEWQVACRRGARFRLAYNNNGSESTISYVVLDSGQYTFGEQKDHIEFVSSTGTQQLKVYAYNFDKASDLYAYAGCIEYT
jgi:hypothetical protein